VNELATLCLAIVLLPLAGSIIAGFFGQAIGRTWSHRVTIGLVAAAFLVSLWIAKLVFMGGMSFNGNIYTWASGGSVFPYAFHIGFLVDPLTAVMLMVVTFVSWLVHIYSIGYMVDDDGYQRFFSYISLFTFAMLMLVSANNFLQLFFGWEGVGLVSYLLIGFWFKRESAIAGGLKAFLVNRVGDFGLILGLAVILSYTGSLSYQDVFKQAPTLANTLITIIPGQSWSVVTVACILLFIGAMGKSAQVPLHVWLPESMEGPTPISALIHAATMVTAGVFMVARMSPLYEYSNTALSMVTIIGATGALFTGILALVMFDIKRVVAYSTLSQLGYMMVAMGVSAYPVGMFHLATHACFKALLFLAAGSVIIAMHHEQDMRKMGGLYKYMPITYVSSLIGTLALCALPPFAGFYSKDAIIEAAHFSSITGAHYAYWCVLIGAFVTAVYSFRAFFMTFHGEPRMDEKTRSHLRESPWVVTLPLVVLAIPSVIMGFLLAKPMLYAEPTVFGNAIFIAKSHTVMTSLTEEFHGVWAAIIHGMMTPTFWLVIAGIIVATICYVVKPGLPAMFAERFSVLYRILVNKYGFDEFNDKVIIRGTKAIGQGLFTVGDRIVIDGLVVNGSAWSVRAAALQARLGQTGYIFHYAMVMVVSLIALLSWLILG